MMSFFMGASLLWCGIAAAAKLAWPYDLANSRRGKRFRIRGFAAIARDEIVAAAQDDPAVLP
jgi:hypothetical protein